MRSPRTMAAKMVLVAFLSFFPWVFPGPLGYASDVQGRAVPPAERECRSAIAAADTKIDSLRKAARVFSRLSREPAPSRLAEAERIRNAEYDKWLQGAAARCEGLAAKWERGIEPARRRCGEAGSRCDFASAAREVREMNMSYNLQYLQLQNQMQNENRQFTMVSNIMKTKHDTVKNSIGNIR